ncbi:MAG: hypothetical protein LBE95_02915 [Holosporaceae bacterium]|jgi:hypothetical protein|nr:hypothetical protein [Holosporaceae bacterium]
MADELSSVIEEINEELKNDQLLTFCKKYKNAIFAAIAVVVSGILIYSSWYSRKIKQREEITNALLRELQSPSGRDSRLIDGLLENAPMELRPILSIIKSGKKLSDFEDMLESANALLVLTQKHGVDAEWKDLATIVYVSYQMKPANELIKMLEPLTGGGRPFRFTACELMAVIHENNGNHEKALEYLNKIIESKEAPKALKKRMEMLRNHIKNNLEKK